MSGSYSIHNIPLEERPRERLRRYGAESMSTADLIAIILSSGSKGISVLQLAHSIIARFGTLKGVAEATLEELCLIKGMGVTKAIQLKAALSLGGRVARQQIPMKYKIEHPLHAYHLVKEELEKEKRELFLVVLQDIKGYLITHQVVSIGTLSESLIHPREVFYPAVRHKASSVILVHNHPSGDPNPSREDYEVTEALVKVGRLMDIPVRDHLIIGSQGYVSLRSSRRAQDTFWD